MSTSDKLIQLYYLPLRARSEPVNLILAYGKVPHEFHIVQFNDWPNEKAALETNMFGQLPSARLPNGKIISQSGALARYFARLAGVHPR